MQNWKLRKNSRKIAGQSPNSIKTTVKDGNANAGQIGSEKTSYRDVRQLITTVSENYRAFGSNKGSGKNLVTKYQYDPLKQITDVYDDLDNHTHVDYDKLGRRIKIENPDTGVFQDSCRIKLKYFYATCFSGFNVTIDTGHQLRV